MKKYLLLAFLCFLGASVYSQSRVEQIIRASMDQQVNCWNEGQIDCFMDTYWKSDSLLFIGKSGVTYGWRNTLNNYKRSYPDTAAMGKLVFTILRIQKLSSRYYNVIGRWQLLRSMGNLQGHFTLVFKKIGSRWVIVQDHSS